jgi:hypothetical protein
MTVVVTTVAGGDADVLDAQLAFHRVAGAAHAVVTTIEPSGEVEAVLARHAGSGSLHVTREPQSAHEAEWRTRMARFAATELGADWVVNLRAGEFWWPRAESLGDALVAIPPRYTIVQGHVPLRGWYPLEVLTFPRTGGEAGALTDQAVEQGLADGSLADDARLQHALETLRAGGRLDLPAPDVVDDATYAVECAAVGEVDTTRLIARLDELEARIAELEQGLRARVVRRLSRLAGGGRR